MKKCNFCETETTDDIMQCESCGAKDFLNICNNCGNVYEGSQCPRCGVFKGEKPRTCYNCGKKTYREICPDCGASLVRKQQPVNAVYAEQPYRPPVTESLKRRYHKEREKKKTTGCLKFLIIFLLIISIVSIARSKTNNNENTGSNVYTQKQKKVSDLDILTLSGHPKFYDNHTEAKKFYKAYKKVNIISSHQSMYHKEDLLALATGDDDSDQITSVYINLVNSDDSIKKDLNLEAMMNIVSEYLPYEILDKYYVFDKSFHETYKESEYEAYHYVMSRNKVTYERDKDTGINYEGKFAFVIGRINENDWFAQIDYLAYKGYSEKYPNRYTVEDWDIDIDKYRTD